MVELERALTDSKRREVDLKRECDMMQVKIDDLESRETTLKNTVEITKKTIDENNQLINHLNRQLTDRASGLKMQPSFAGSTVPYPMTRTLLASGMTGMGPGRSMSA